MSQISGVAIASIGAGALFVYAGITGRDIPKALQAVVQGKQPSTAAVSEPITTTSGTTTSGGQSSPGTVTGNKALGRLLAAAYGWGTGAEWTALDELWTRESGWDNKAENPSGAYGIPQALPPTKMPLAAQAAGGSNATAQINWGLGYIKSTYGDPEAAWAHEESAGWY